MNNIKVLYFDRIDVSEGIDVQKSAVQKESKKCNICRYWYFLNKVFKFQQSVCNKCYDLLMMFMSLSDIAILNIYCHITTESLYKFIL